jgi:hypothetical protein
VFVIAQLLTHLGLQRRSNTRFVSWDSSPFGPDELEALLPSLGRQLLGDTLLVQRRYGRLLFRSLGADWAVWVGEQCVQPCRYARTARTRR